MELPQLTHTLRLQSIMLVALDMCSACSSVKRLAPLMLHAAVLDISYGAIQASCQACILRTTASMLGLWQLKALSALHH